jgi:serine/threonine protein phosphatase PrpC
MCLLYTDGLSEILDEKGIEELLLHHENEPLDVIRSISSDSLMNESNELIDDITIIAFKRIC